MLLACSPVAWRVLMTLRMACLGNVRKLASRLAITLTVLPIVAMAILVFWFCPPPSSSFIEFMMSMANSLALANTSLLFNGKTISTSALSRI
jgi:hypothetical protein